MITGANRGGKSTFLRGIGLAQLMMQCGMFVPAAVFPRQCLRWLFTHFKREEDASMRSGKLDEELSRMSAIIDNITPHSIVLFNESFASTNEREGSEIARQIVRALLERGVKVLLRDPPVRFGARVSPREDGRRLVPSCRKAGRRAANVSTCRRRAVADELWRRFVSADLRGGSARATRAAIRTFIFRRDSPSAISEKADGISPTGAQVAASRLWGRVRPATS